VSARYEGADELKPDFWGCASFSAINQDRSFAKSISFDTDNGQTIDIGLMP
jgi:hypothetical protein